MKITPQSQKTRNGRIQSISRMYEERLRDFTLLLDRYPQAIQAELLC